MIRSTVAAALLFALIPGDIAAQTRAADSTEILELIRQREDAMRRGQAETQRRFMAPDAIWLNGQRLADGRVINRRIHTTFVVSKEADRWLIRYEHISDERDRTAAR